MTRWWSEIAAPCVAAHNPVYPLQVTEALAKDVLSAPGTEVKLVSTSKVGERAGEG